MYIFLTKCEILIRNSDNLRPKIAKFIFSSYLCIAKTNPNDRSKQNCMENRPMFIRCGGQLVDLRQPVFMAIVNATDDSFFAASRGSSPERLKELLLAAENSQAALIDIGACSTRPAVQAGGNNKGSKEQTPALASAEQEWQRLQQALTIARDLGISKPLSVDTFRPEIAERAIREFGVDIINDISGGSDEMFALIADTRVPYVLTYNDPEYNLSHETIETEHVVDFLGRRIDDLRRRGAGDIIIDPGFGFTQTVSQSLDLLNRLHELLCLECPILVGISRKRMAYQPAGKTPETCLEETIALERKALCHGAHIIRCHDVGYTRVY